MSRESISFTFPTSTGEQRSVALLLDPSQFTQRSMLDQLRQGAMYEADIAVFLHMLLRPGDVFWDLGGHIGFFSMLAAQLVGPTGRVVTVEPELANIQHIKDHIAANDASHVTVVEAAISETPGTATFFVNPDNDGGHALWRVGDHPFNARSRAQGHPSREVRVTSIEALLAEGLPLPRVVKLDVEGNEVATLRGARARLERGEFPYLVPELNDFALQRMGSNQEAFRDLLAECGYTVYVFLPDQQCFTRLVGPWRSDSVSVLNLLCVHRTAVDPFQPVT